MSDNALVPAEGRTDPNQTTVERWGEPMPGTYWRVLENIDPAHDEESEQITGNGAVAGTVLMLSEIETADGAPHVYVFEPHPMVKKNWRVPMRVHVDVFHQWFAFAPDGEEVRSRELEDLLGEMARTQAQMMQPPPDQVPAGLLGHDPSPVGAPGTELATRDSVGQLESYAQRIQESSQALTGWIETCSKKLGSQANALARFHGERAQAQLAKAKQQLEGVAGLLRTVENLNLYVGEGQEVLQVRDGAPAAPGEPLTIYQDFLALDEESALYLEAGGLDHTHAEELPQILDDLALVDRMIPASRGVVLVQFRASIKMFTEQQDMGARLYNVRMNQEAQQRHLLVRDGERLWMVALPQTLQGLTQLMPTIAEQAEQFTHHSGSEIRREHLSYARAQRQQMGSLDAYAKVLIVLWGLFDRAQLLTGWNMPRFTNWLDPAVHHRYLVLCDQSTMIGQEHESFADYRARHNRYLGRGATVAVSIDPLFAQDNIPGAFASQSHYTGRTHVHTQMFEWDCPRGETVLVARARQDARGLYVEVPLKRGNAYYGRGDGGRRITGKMYLPSNRSEHYLVLDRVHGPDMTYFLTSRSQRRSYASYLLLFRKAREWVLARDEAETSLRQALARAAVDAGLAEAGEGLESAITSAIAVTRTARRDKQIPDTNSAGFRGYMRAALDTLHSLLTQQDTRIARVEAWAQEAGRELLRLALAGGTQWRLYLVPVPQEHNPLLGAPAHTTVCAIDWTAEALIVTVEGRAMLESQSSEHIVKEWERTEIVPGNKKSPFYDENQDKVIEHGARGWMARKSLFPMLTYDEAVSVLDAVRAAPASLPTAAAVYNAAMTHQNRTRRRMRIAIPVGILAGIQGNPLVMFAYVGALQYAYAFGDKGIRGLARNWGVAPCEPVDLEWEIGGMTFEQARQHFRRDLGHEQTWRMHRSEIANPTKKKDSVRRYRLTALNEAGAKWLPWAVRLTESAI